jgi:hypothetical protein
MVISLSVSASANIVEAVGMGIAEIVMPYIVDGALKSEEQKKAQTANTTVGIIKMKRFFGIDSSKKEEKEVEIEATENKVVETEQNSNVDHLSILSGNQNSTWDSE